ncbi:MAG: acyclic terpene utilization AtuA family protein [Pusillimonas sp.]
MRAIRIGAGAGYSGDRIPPAVELADKGHLDYLVFECLAERTVALAQLEKIRNPNLGFDPLLRDRMEAVLVSCMEKGIKIITNMGAANPEAAAKEVLAVARERGIDRIKVCIVHGDDILSQVMAHDPSVIETANPISSIKDSIISANAYLGAEPIVDALKMGADVVITGRVSDPALFLAPLIYEFGWPTTDWEKMGQGVLVGHLLECAGQVTGGYFADPGYRDVPNLGKLGFPIAEVSEDGTALITKVSQAGGYVTPATCAAQLLYEVENPEQYLQPDVVADFSRVTLTEVSKDCVKIEGATGTHRPSMIKATVGRRDGFIGDGQISYAGLGAKSRGQLALDILRERLEETNIEFLDIRYELLGLNAIHGATLSAGYEPYEVRVRLAVRTTTKKEAELAVNEVEALYLNGPAGGGGATKSVREVISAVSVLMPRDLITTSVSSMEL